MTTEPSMALRPTAHRWPVIAWLTFSQLAGLASLLMWFVVVMTLSLIPFDGRPPAESMVVSILLWLYPPVMLGCALSAWFLFWRRHDTAAGLVSGLPLLPPMLYLAYLLLARR